MLWIGRVGVFLPLLAIVYYHIGDTAFGLTCLYVYNISRPQGNNQLK